MKYVILLLCLIPSVLHGHEVVAKLEAINPPNQLWLDRANADIVRSNQFLCHAFSELPDSVRLVHTNGPPQYDLALNSIFLNKDYLPIHLYHEYGHRVLDDYLTKHSSVLAYYQVRIRLGGERLPIAMQKLKKMIDEEQVFVQQLQQRQHFQLANNLSYWIEKHEQLLFDASALLHLDEALNSAFLQFFKSKNRSLLKMQAPYHELFADALAVMISGHWDSVIMISSAENPSSRYHYNFSHKHLDALHLRGFHHSIANFHQQRFSDQIAHNHYLQLAPSRAYFRYLADSGYKDQKPLLLLKLAQAIQHQLDAQLSSPYPLFTNLEEKNQSLINSLKSRLVITTAQRQNHCEDQSPLALMRY